MTRLLDAERRSIRVDLPALTLIAQPPGPAETMMIPSRHIFDVQLQRTRPELVRWTGENETARCEVARGLSWFPAGADLHVRCARRDWALTVEIAPERAVALDPERAEDAALSSRFVPWTLTERSDVPARLLVEHLRSGSRDRLYAEGLALSLFSEALTLFGEAGSRAGSTGDPRLRQARDFIEAHFGESLSVERIAAEAGMSAGHFSRAFKAATGETVWAYVQRRRCECARDRIVGTRQSLAEIAFACGFSNQGHMTSAFRRHFGITPGAFRS